MKPNGCRIENENNSDLSINGHLKIEGFKFGWKPLYGDSFCHDEQAFVGKTRLLISIIH